MMCAFIVLFVNIGRIVDHHCLTFLYITNVMFLPENFILEELSPFGEGKLADSAFLFCGPLEDLFTLLGTCI